ncbi:hypothetical protein [Dyadobacter psychrotolerans]|uniref:Helix-turn-helix domain-containing protein n=1 Tax=Dyadobacter psychrotolerans TaxID=2541721 RepID=A0A4R5DVL0_9BACT|nr:hypothetical protein [Dyadobacter psychrotolerans]TDE18592.1 hypothetical protein E0F88_03375 [Dyadobacter psychrotolerans]
MAIIETVKMLTREEALQEGIEKGADKRSYEVVTKLLLSGKFSISEIANFAGVTETFVRKVRKDNGL